MGNLWAKGEVAARARTSKGELKVPCDGSSVYLAGAEREPFAKLYFTLDRSRNERQTKVQLSVDQVDFVVRNCCTRNCYDRKASCHKNCKTVFIHKITIQVIPKSWAQDCRRMLLNPYPTAGVFALQRSVILGSQMPLACPQKACLTYQRGSTVSFTTPEFGWSPARGDSARNSVSWTWELYRYTNGKEFDRPRWGPRPWLVIRPDQMHIPPGSFRADASWEIPASAELQQLRLGWDVKVTLHTAVLQSKRRVLGYSANMGPALTFDKLIELSELSHTD